VQQVERPWARLRRPLHVTAPIAPVVEATPTEQLAGCLQERRVDGGTHHPVAPLFAREDVKDWIDLIGSSFSERPRCA
jgi:hypothetical protein